MDEFNTQALIMSQNPMANQFKIYSNPDSGLGPKSWAGFVVWRSGFGSRSVSGIWSGVEWIYVMVCTFFSSSNQLAFRFKMSRRIQGIKKKLASISNDKSFILEQGRQETTLTTRRVRDADFYVRKEDVIGREKDRSVIIDNLLSESSDQESVSVIAIVGIGGLGKTTLAKTKGEVISGDMGTELLVKKLREVLGGNRYFVVLDDIWEEDHAKLLKLKDLIISNENAGSRVVITTRSENIAKFLTTEQQPYRLGVLDEVESWSLFRKVAFEDGSQELDNSSIVQIGKEIVKRCKGIPLAIKTIGNILHGKRSFFQDVEVDECRVIEKCKMHDLIHDLAVQVAGEECTTFVISNGQGNIKETSHHVSFYGDTYSAYELPVLLVHAKKFRTVLGSSKDQTFCDAIISNCKFIRCLDLKGSSRKLVSNSIGKLKHL
ncbi:hypothetical protein G4B88_001227 [Cannabis sativa]|uniref:NB-ARC domain-containing protein n=1 Tax=Cannabis sativa TaxID=3483 RepID=A0A7J6EDA6_CANSA|nr:hypothetical protein G4B88_001227 [Cannabis sativa]